MKISDIIVNESTTVSGSIATVPQAVFPMISRLSMDEKYKYSDRKSRTPRNVGRKFKNSVSNTIRFRD